ncbi:MAG: hypothetical protein IJ912_03850 [Fibrobacter sp.]|nr:hypothetical protein [Fibrobacter sp.]
MKNAKIFTGVAAASITLALSFALLACGDDSTSTAPEPVADGNGSAVEESSSSELPPDTTCCKVTLSSSSEEQSPSSVSSSSSFDVPLSSETCCIDFSSSSQGEKIVQRIDDIFGTCRDKKVDPMLDAALPPVTYLGYEDGDDSATVVVENVSMHCRSISGTVSIIRQPIVGNLHLSTSGDTLYMIQYSLDTVSAEPDCICDSRLIFKVKADPAIINATVFVAVRDGDYGNRMEIVKGFPPDEQGPRDTIPAAQDSVPESNQTDLELKGFERGKCMNDDLAAKPVAKSAATELPEARQITYMNGETVLTLENVTDYCGIDAKVSQKMSGDTLMLAYYDQTNVTKCICNFDKIEFLIEPENAAAKYVKFKDVVYWVNVIMYEVDPNWKG